MKVDVLQALFASAVLYGVGGVLFLVNKKIITWAADEVFGTFQRQGEYAVIRTVKDALIRTLKEEEEEEEEEEDLPGRVQVIDDVGKKCD